MHCSPPLVASSPREASGVDAITPLGPLRAGREMVVRRCLAAEGAPVLARRSAPLFTDGIFYIATGGGAVSFNECTGVVGHTGSFYWFIGRDFECIKYDTYTDPIYGSTGGDFFIGIVNYTRPLCGLIGFTYWGIGEHFFTEIAGYTGTIH